MSSRVGQVWECDEPDDVDVFVVLSSSDFDADGWRLHKCLQLTSTKGPVVDERGERREDWPTLVWMKRIV